MGNSSDLCILRSMSIFLSNSILIFNPQFKEGLKIKMLFDKNIDILRKMHKSEELSEEDLLCVKHIGHGENRVKKRNKEEGEEGIGKKETSDDNKDECASAKGNQEDTEDKES